MPASNPSPPPDASGTVRGLVSLIAQTFAGVKTFLARAVFPLGITSGAARLDLRSDLGGGASDVCSVVGSTVADASVNADAKLLSVRTGLGGTEVERFHVKKDGGIVTGSTSTLTGGWSTANSCTMSGGASLTMSGAGAGGQLLTLGANTGDRAVIRNWVGASGASATSPAITLEQVNGSLDAGDTLISFRDNSVERFRQYAGGDVELMTTAAGVILRSPDGTRWKLTITNAGAVNVALA